MLFEFTNDNYPPGMNSDDWKHFEEDDDEEFTREDYEDMEAD